MRFIQRMAIIPAVFATCGLVAGCFSYHRTVDETTAPAPVVETVPAAPAVVAVPAPAVVTAPVTSSSTTTTTTDSAIPGVVERQKTTTYSTPY